MPKFSLAEPGTFCIIQQTEDGRIRQIAMTEEQSKALQLFLGAMSSEERPLIAMPEEYDLVLKREIH